MLSLESVHNNHIPSSPVSSFIPSLRFCSCYQSIMRVLQSLSLCQIGPQINDAIALRPIKMTLAHSSSHLGNPLARLVVLTKLRWSAALSKYK